MFALGAKSVARHDVIVLEGREGDAWVVHAPELSYFSRLTDAATLGRLALVETHRRGTETVRTVCAVTDGAERILGFVDLHRLDVVRSLDFPHAMEFVARARQAVYGEGTAACLCWVTMQRQELRHGNAGEVIDARQPLVVQAKGSRARRPPSALPPTRGKRSSIRPDIAGGSRLQWGQILRLELQTLLPQTLGVPKALWYNRPI
jgi:hypothetical protein